jgi:hypothetical protein
VPADVSEDLGLRFPWLFVPDHGSRSGGTEGIDRADFHMSSMQLLERLDAVKAGKITTVLLLLLAAYFYVEAPRHPTLSIKMGPPLVNVERVRGLERGSGPNLASPRSDFVKGGWTREGVVVSANAATAPDGMNTAYRLLETNETDRHRIETKATGGTAGAIHTLSLYVKPEERRVIMFEMRDADAGRYGVTHFDVGNGRVTYEAGDVSDAGIQQLPDGWFRVWAAMPYASDAAVFNFALLGNQGAPKYTGSRGAGLLIWGVQFEPASRPGGYAAAQHP